MSRALQSLMRWREQAGQPFDKIASPPIIDVSGPPHPDRSPGWLRREIENKRAKKAAIVAGLNRPKPKQVATRSNPNRPLDVTSEYASWAAEGVAFRIWRAEQSEFYSTAQDDDEVEIGTQSLFWRGRASPPDLTHFDGRPLKTIVRAWTGFKRPKVLLIRGTLFILNPARDA